jgi:hypothetical protein
VTLDSAVNIKQLSRIADFDDRRDVPQVNMRSHLRPRNFGAGTPPRDAFISFLHAYISLHDFRQPAPGQNSYPNAVQLEIN